VSPRPQIDHVRRPQLLEAAAGVIAERGIAATRIADVAERAGTSPPAVLYWFESKDELLAEALTVDEERYYQALTERLEALESPRRRLRVLLESSAEEYDSRLWMEIWTRALHDTSTRRARRRLDQRWRAQIAAVIRDGQRAGDFGDADPDDGALVLASLIDGLAVQVTLGDPDVPKERMLRCVLEIAESLLDCELGAAAYETAPHLANSELRRELE
jgi:AcrR family transcriptional regulator